MSSIVVYGATGLTGGLVTEALMARGVTPLLAGRDAAKLRATAVRRGLDPENIAVADPSQPPDIARMVERASVVVSCAGPFLEFGEPTLAACAARGVHYADSTGEASFVRMVARRYDATARARGCALVPAAAFEVAVADAAAARAAEGLGDDVDVEVAYGIAHNATTHGTRASLAAMLGQPSLAFVGGEVREEPVAAHARTVAFHAPVGTRAAVSFPGPEVITVPRHVRARSVRAFMSAGGAPALRTLARFLAPAAALVSPVVRRVIDRGDGRAPSPEARRATRFQVVVTARSADGSRTRRVTVAGSDPYTLSGALLAEAAMALAGARVQARGMLAPSQVIGVETVFALVQLLEGGGVSVEEA